MAKIYCGCKNAHKDCENKCKKWVGKNIKPGVVFFVKQWALHQHANSVAVPIMRA